MPLSKKAMSNFRQPKSEKELFETIKLQMTTLYKKQLHVLEQNYCFHDFHSPALTDADFSSKPMVLLIGQYSSGKTTFIKHILEQDFPGMRIGPEPTTDGFMAIMAGKSSDENKKGPVTSGIIPGNVLVADPDKPFAGLDRFGNCFLEKFACSQLEGVPLLERMSFIDTPGILAGQKQRLDRGYDFKQVVRWFAERVDRIVLLFDAHKLDISDEFRETLHALRGCHDKIRIVLNKADQVNTQQLMRCYGALMWSLGKVINTPEVPRVNLGSFWDKAFQNTECRNLFEAESRDLFSDLDQLPGKCMVRKLNDLIKRKRLAVVHARIMGYLKDNYPAFIGRDKAKKRLIEKLPEIFEALATKYKMSKGDFPNVPEMREQLRKFDWSKLRSLDERRIHHVSNVMNREVPALLRKIEQSECMKTASTDPAYGGRNRLQDEINDSLNRMSQKDNPFAMSGFGEGAYAGIGEQWIVGKKMEEYVKRFEALNPHNGKISGSAIKKELQKSKLKDTVLGKIWKLSDIDNDGKLCVEEFALALHLIDIKLDGHELPKKLPNHLIPPSHRERMGLGPNDSPPFSPEVVLQRSKSAAGAMDLQSLSITSDTPTRRRNRL